MNRIKITNRIPSDDALQSITPGQWHVIQALLDNPGGLTTCELYDLGIIDPKGVIRTLRQSGFLINTSRVNGYYWKGFRYSNVAWYSYVGWEEPHEL